MRNDNLDGMNQENCPNTNYLNYPMELYSLTYRLIFSKCNLFHLIEEFSSLAL